MSFRTIIFLVFFLMCGISHAKDIVFIGSPISATNIDKSCMEFVGPNDLCMDVAFELVYKIDQVFEGDPGDRIKFIGFYHYSGLPRYTNHGKALLHLKPNHEGQLLLVNLKSLQYLESDEEEYSSLIHCEQWTEEDECSKSISASDLAKKWQES